MFARHYHHHRQTHTQIPPLPSLAAAAPELMPAAVGRVGLVLFGPHSQSSSSSAHSLELGQPAPPTRRALSHCTPAGTAVPGWLLCCLPAGQLAAVSAIWKVVAASIRIGSLQRHKQQQQPSQCSSTYASEQIQHSLADDSEHCRSSPRPASSSRMRPS